MDGRVPVRGVASAGSEADRKNTTLEKFGQQQADGTFEPFHLYSMKQAIEEGFILDVLANYTTYKSYYEIAKSIEDNPLFDTKKAQKLSTIIDVAASRFANDLQLEVDAQIDFKVKAKQFVKIYGQMASIMPFEVVDWEKLFWFLKFLIPKLKIEDPTKVSLDELLEAVDLSSYGLERVKLNHAIVLDASETELAPQNPNPRGSHGTDEQKDSLDEIVRSFNEHWFQGWSATPEEQRVKFVNIANSIKAHPDFTEKYKNNPDPHNRELAFEKMLKDVMLMRRKDELELYKLFAGDAAFKASWQQSMERLINR